MASEQSTRRDLRTPKSVRSFQERAREALAMMTVGLLVSVMYVAWVGLFVFSTNDLA